MTSCQCDHDDLRFDEVYATDKLNAYRDRGPDPSTQALVDALTSAGIEGRTLLDIGGGVGAVQHELLRAGLASVYEVEASPAHAEACREEAQRLGHDERIDHFVGDFGSVADAIPDADIVTLDRSMCCWPDMPELVGRSAAKATWLYGLVYPRDTWWVRHGWRIRGEVRRLFRRDPMWVYIYRTRDVERVLRAEGMTRRSLTELGIWQVAVYERTRAAA